MSVRPLLSYFPTVRRLQGRLAAEDGFPQWHIRATIVGVTVIVLLGMGEDFFTMAKHG